MNVLMWWALSYAQLIPRTVNGDFVKTMHRATTPVDPDVHLFDVQKIGGIDDNTDKSGRLTDNQSTKNQRRFTLNAKDCSKPKSVSQYLYSQVCENPKNDTEFKDRKKTKVTIVQYVPEVKRRGLRCTIFESRLFEYCGRYSHMKLMAPPQIKEPKPMPAEMCAQVLNNNQYTDETGTQHTVRLDADESLYVRFLRHGKISMSSTNVFCDGSTLQFDGDQRDQVMEFVSLQVQFSWVDVVRRDTGRVEDLDNQRELPGTCATDSSCRSHMTSYAFRDEPGVCPHLKKIKDVEVYYDKLTIGTEVRDVVYSHSDHLLLPLSAAEPMPRLCASVAKQLYTTAFNELKIIKAADYEDMGRLKEVEAENVHVLLSEKVESTYLLYRAKEMLNHQRATMGEKLCELSREAWATSDFSNFHPHTILRRRGEVVRIVKRSVGDE